MSIGFWQIAIVVILVVLLFGRGKISSLMGDVAKGIKSFKKGMASDVTDDSQPKNISENNQDSDKKSKIDAANRLVRNSNYCFHSYNCYWSERFSGNVKKSWFMDRIS